VALGIGGVAAALVFLSAHDWVEIWNLVKVGGIGSVIGGMVVGLWVYYSDKGEDRFDHATMGVLIGVVVGGLAGASASFALP
jgi:hypothetical protein